MASAVHHHPVPPSSFQPALVNDIPTTAAIIVEANTSCAHSITCTPSSTTSPSFRAPRSSCGMSIACAASAGLMTSQSSMMVYGEGENDSRTSNALRNNTTTSTRRGPNLVYWLRGLPFQAQRSDVEAFLSGIDYSKLDIGVLENGECSGNAFVELKGSKHQAELESLHNAFIPISAHATMAADVRPKPRFVEVMPSNPAKRLEQLEHDRCLPRDATRRQRRLQSGFDNADVDSFNAHFTTSFNTSFPNGSFPNGSFPTFVNMSNNSSSQFSNLSISANVPMPPPPPQPQQQQQQQQTCYVPYGVQMPSSSIPTHFIPNFSNYATPTNLPAMVSFAPQLIGDVAAGSTPQTYPLPYDYVGAVQSAPYFGQPIAIQQQPHPHPQPQTQTQTQPQPSMPTMLFSSPYATTSFALPPSYS